VVKQPLHHTILANKVDADPEPLERPTRLLDERTVAGHVRKGEREFTAVEFRGGENRSKQGTSKPMTGLQRR
jgi:hypothetical protein